MVELRRERKVFLRLAALTVAISALFYLAGKRTAPELLAAMIGSGIGAVLIVPMGIARDKLEGTLDFICTLPVTPGVIAASRLAAMAVLAMPWAAGVGMLSVTLRVPNLPGAMLVTLMAWLMMVMLGAIATAFFALFELEQILGAPLFAMVVFFVVAPRLFRWFFPNVSAGLVWSLVSRPSTVMLLTGAGVLIFAGLGAVSFVATERGFAAYQLRSN